MLHYLYGNAGGIKKVTFSTVEDDAGTCGKDGSSYA